MTPDQARLKGRNHRKSLSPALRAWANRCIQQHLQHLSGRIGTYWALPEEADPGRRPGQYLPVINGSSLEFRHYRSDADCEPGALNIPIPREGETLQAQSLDWVLVPLTAFDSTGQRVGMGGGFYDQTLDKVPSRRRIGIAYQGQQVSRIQSEDWDLPLGAVVTPRGWMRF